MCKHIFMRKYNDMNRDLELICIICGYRIIMKKNGEKYEMP